MRFSVFTPTYNRGHLLSILYKSLLIQSFNDFEWIVVDDGSTDNTSDVIKTFKNAPFDIRYIKTENKGKHNAINIGVSIANGELFFIVDSDDSLLPDSLKICDNIEKTIPLALKNSFAGICGLRMSPSTNKIIGTTFSSEGFLDITTLERSKNGIAGDKCEIFYTSILRKYPFPIFDNEKFCTEALVWDRIAHDGYKMRFFNSAIYLSEYLNDGLTKKYQQLIINNPKAWGCYIHQSIVYKKNTKINNICECSTFYFYEKKKYSFSEIKSMLSINSYKLILFLIISKIYIIFIKIKKAFYK